MEGGALEAEGRESWRAWDDMGSVLPKGHRRQAGQERSDQQGKITGALGAIPSGAEEKRSKELQQGILLCSQVYPPLCPNREMCWGMFHGLSTFHEKEGIAIITSRLFQPAMGHRGTTSVQMPWIRGGHSWGQKTLL